MDAKTCSDWLTPYATRAELKTLAEALAEENAIADQEAESKTREHVLEQRLTQPATLTLADTAELRRLKRGESRLLVFQRRLRLAMRLRDEIFPLGKTIMERVAGTASDPRRVHEDAKTRFTKRLNAAEVFDEMAIASAMRADKKLVDLATAAGEFATRLETFSGSHPATFAEDTIKGAGQIVTSIAHRLIHSEGGD